MSPKREANVHRLFEFALLLKAADSLLEVIGGLLLALVSTDKILAIVQRLTDHELGEDPHDFIANYALRMAQSLSVDSKTGAALFLFSHGLIKLALVAGVLAGFGWAYPAFIAALALLIAYQSYQLSEAFSTGLFALTMLDLLVLVLTVHEYRLRRAAKSAAHRAAV